jgi:ribosomal protein S12 methylthiotransferase accessory factor YcaO
MKQHGHHLSPMRRGFALLCCGLALGAASTVALVNALYEMVE